MARPRPPLRWLKDTVHSALGRCGYQLERDEGRLRLRKRVVLGAGDYVPIIRFTIGVPRTALVLGAFEGAGAVHLHRAFPKARIWAFEPDPTSFQRLAGNAAGTPIVPVPLAIGAADGTAQLHRNRGRVTNSLLPSGADDRTLETEETVPVEVTTLDSWCDRAGLTQVDYIHADLQGYEGRMLEGARGLLEARRIRLVLLEVSFDRFYEGQATFEHLYATMTRHGYRFVCTQGMFFAPGAVYPRGGNLVFVAA